MDNKKKRVSIKISEEAYWYLKKVAAELRLTMSEAVEKAIITLGQ